MYSSKPLNLFDFLKIIFIGAKPVLEKDLQLIMQAE